jgi:hypothetical protein
LNAGRKAWQLAAVVVSPPTNTRRLPRPDEVFGSGSLVVPTPELTPETGHDANAGVLVETAPSTRGNIGFESTGFLRYTESMIVRLLAEGARCSAHTRARAGRPGPVGGASVAQRGAPNTRGRPTALELAGHEHKRSLTPFAIGFRSHLEWATRFCLQCHDGVARGASHFQPQALIFP